MSEGFLFCLKDVLFPMNALETGIKDVLSFKGCLQIIKGSVGRMRGEGGWRKRSERGGRRRRDGGGSKRKKVGGRRMTEGRWRRNREGRGRR